MPRVRLPRAVPRALRAPAGSPAIVAAVVYAAPVVIKIIADGISGVSPTTMEAATAAGSSTWQIITKVQLPMSRKRPGARHQPGPDLRAVDGGRRRPGRRRRASATTSWPASRRDSCSARAWPPAWPSCCSGSCSTGSPRPSPGGGGEDAPCAGALSTPTSTDSTDGSSPGRHQMQIARRTGRGRGPLRVAVVAAAIGLVASGCGGAKVGATSSAGGRLLRQVRHLQPRGQPLGRLRGGRGGRRATSPRSKLGCKVIKKNLNEEVVWQGFGTGEVDAVLENWGHDDLEKKYITEQKIAVDARPDRQQGHDRLVRAAVAGQGAPGHHRLEQPQQVRRRCSRPRSRAARASCSTATRRSSPTTRRW